MPRHGTALAPSPSNLLSVILGRTLAEDAANVRAAKADAKARARLDLGERAQEIRAREETAPHGCGVEASTREAPRAVRAAGVRDPEEQAS